MKPLSILAALNLSGMAISLAMTLAISPANAQELNESEPQLIRNAIVHTPTGVQTDTDVLIKNGTISAIGHQLPSGADTLEIDAQGKHLYPTLISLDSQIGLKEIGAVRSTVDSREVGNINPQLRAASAFNVESEVLPTLRANGIGYAQITPQGSMLAGQSALVQFDGWNIRDSLIADGTGMHLYWPRTKPHPWYPVDDIKDQYQRQHTELLRIFEDASHYLQTPREQIDIRWQSMAALFSGTQTLFVHADHLQQIEHALLLANKYKFKLVIVGGYESYRIGEQLAAADVAVIYTHAKGLPQHSDEAYDIAFRIPAMLAKQGVKVALTFSGSWEGRNLAFVAGQAIAFGLEETAALNAITATPAKLLGQDKLGRIEVGAPASLILSRGDLFDPSQHGVEQMWLEGRPINLDNRHQRLYEKYQKRYQQ